MGQRGCSENRGVGAAVRVGSSYRRGVMAADVNRAEWDMALTIAPDKRTQLHASVKRYIIENFDADAGDLKARLMLDFCLQEIGAVVYNQAIGDAQAYMQGRLADLEAIYYADEFTFWPRK